MINRHQNQRQNFYNFVFGQEERSTSMKVERLKQITEISEIKQIYSKGFQLGKTSQNALRIIHQKLEKQRQTRKLQETKSEVEEESFPYVKQIVTKLPLAQKSKIGNKENIIQMPNIIQKQKVDTIQISPKKRTLSQRIKMKKSEATQEYSPWGNQEMTEFDYF